MKKKNIIVSAVVAQSPPDKNSKYFYEHLEMDTTGFQNVSHRALSKVAEDAGVRRTDCKTPLYMSKAIETVEVTLFDEFAMIIGKAVIAVWVGFVLIEVLF